MELIDTDPPKKDDVTDMLAEARKRREMCTSANSDNTVAAIDDLRFLAGGENQWDALAVDARKLDGRPIITVNSLPTYLHQITNDQRMNTPSIKVHPVDDQADIETAKIMQGMIRHIEYDSNADVAYDTAVNSAAAVGFGYFRLITAYESETSFNQCLRFDRIRNPLSVAIDPLSKEPDGSDMQFCFIDSLMSREDFKLEYPDANASDDSFIGNGAYLNWITKDTVLVCEYYCIEKTEEEVVLLSNGESGFKSDLNMPLPDGVTIVNTRKGTRSRVMWRKITGADELEKREIKCKWIPVFPVYGDEIDIEGVVIRSGIVRNAKGPAQQYNVFMTAATEEVSLRAKSPYIMGEGQEEGHEEEWAQANNRAFPYLTYKPTTVGDKLVPAPQRNPMADIPSGMLAMAAHAADNIKKTTGLFDASLGARGSATSGRQELAQQREGDMANFHFADGLNRTIRHAGRCMVCMIPYYYDTERTIRILGEDETAEYATINQPNPNPKPNEKGEITAILNNMTAGTYDVTVSSGPSFSTQRQESAQFFANAMSAAKDPATAAIVTYLAMKNQDAPGSDIAARMLETLLPPPAKAVIEEEMGGEEEQQPVIQTPKGPLPVAQVPQVLQAMEGQIMQMGEALKQADGAKQQAEAMKQQNEQAALQIEAQKLQQEAQRIEIERFNAETARIEAEAKAQADQQGAQVDAIKAQTDAVKAESDAVNAQANRIRAQMEVDTPPEQQAQIPTLEEIAQLIIASKSQMPSNMTITAPSGQVYNVGLNS